MRTPELPNRDHAQGPPFLACRSLTRLVEEPHMDLVSLRLIHIVTAAFWFGAAVTFAFLQPTAKATAPDGPVP